MVVHAFGINCDALILLLRMASLRLVSVWQRTLLRLQEPRPLTVSANRSFSSLPIAVAACGATVSVVSSSLTVHSSRCRFAARLNSGVRPYKSSFECGRETQPKDALLLQRASVCHRNMEIYCARWASSLPQSCNFPSRSIVLCVFLAHCIGSDASQLASVFLARYGMA